MPSGGNGSVSSPLMISYASIIFCIQGRKCSNKDASGAQNNMGKVTCQEKIEGLEKKLVKNIERLRHMATEYAATREGSAYGCEYYDIQCKVLQTMVEDVKKEIEKLKRERKLI